MATLKVIKAARQAADLVVNTGEHFIIDRDLTFDNISIMSGAKMSFSSPATLIASKIDVYGEFQIGTEDEPISGVTIHLNGEITDSQFGTQGRSIAVYGKFEAFGREKNHVTQLDVDAKPGDGFIVCKVPNDWKIGDQIAVAPSFPVQGDTPDESEDFTITGIDGDKITLSGNIKHLHIGRKFDFTGEWVEGSEYDFRAHVINLTRDIKFTCEVTEFNSRNGEGKVKKGGHIIALPGGVMNGQGVEIIGYGQEESPGRYPWHWHSFSEDHSGDFTGQFIRSSSVHHSNHRGYAQHGSGTTVDSCVLYKFISHGFVFAEQRNNVNNTLINSVGFGGERVFRKSGSNNHFAFPTSDNVNPNQFTKYYHPRGRSIQFERIPGIAWGENYHNRVEGNVFAGGSMMNGLFFSGVSNDRVLKQFRNNTIYACGSEANSNEGTAYAFPYRTTGWGVFCNFEETDGRFRLTNNLIYNCGLGGAWLKPKHVFLNSNKVVGCGIGVNLSRSAVLNNTFIEQFVQDSRTLRNPEYCIEIGMDHAGEHSNFLVKKNKVIGYDYLLAVVKAKNDERFEGYNNVGGVSMVLGNELNTRKGDILFKDQNRNGVIVYRDDKQMIGVMGSAQDLQLIGSNRIDLHDICSVIFNSTNKMEDAKLNGVAMYRTERHDTFQDGYFKEVECYVKNKQDYKVTGVGGHLTMTVTGLKGMNVSFLFPKDVELITANYESAVFIDKNEVTITRVNEPRTIIVEIIV